MAKWSDKDIRQYEHIKESTLADGRSESVAQEIAARTVNKRRRKEGRTPNKASGRNKHTKWHGRPAHVLTGETPVPRDGYGSTSTASRPRLLKELAIQI